MERLLKNIMTNNITDFKNEFNGMLKKKFQEKKLEIKKNIGKTLLNKE